MCIRFKKKENKPIITTKDFNNPNLTNHELGILGERFAEQYLTSLGYIILDKNYKGGNFEVDLVAKHGGYLVFIEVKTRRNIHYGLPSEAVTKQKQFSYRLVAEIYQKNKKFYNQNIRFDVLEISKGIPNLIINAFY